ncbi:MAG: protein DA1 [Ignavibacteriales bacterium]|nr:protein DA1 [Ignavibacteriales bacterium]MCF8316038.1 protein DA1 [Ignavibacteriales bacterium]
MKCCVCNGLIIGKYYSDLWGNAAHATHVIERCPACGRLIGESSSHGKITYSDGRFLCGNCFKFENPVQNPELIEQAYFNARKLLSEKGFDFPKNIKVSLVSSEVFSEEGYSESILGLNTSLLSLMERKHHVRILYGLPFTLTSGVIAHEILHVWQHEKGLKPEPMICEGLCELGAGLVYKRTKTPLGERLFANIEKNMLSVYSKGFMTMRSLLESKGWPAVRKYVFENSQNQIKKRGIQ